ncbi:MAG TPA: TolC family protein [bacterium]|jgi:outer membrane protein TolC|nr:TolC family protein [bacterium]
MRLEKEESGRHGGGTFIGLAGLALCSLCFPGRAAADVLGVDQAVQMAKECSPDIRNLKHQVLAAEAQARQALAPQDPGVSASYNDTNQAFQRSTAGSQSFGISQPFTFPGKALLNWSAGMDQAKSLRAQMRSTEMQVAANVRSAYYQLALARKNIDLNDRQEKILEQIVRIVQRRYEAGSVTEVDVANAQMSEYQNQASLADLVLAEKTALSQLDVMLGKPAEAEIQVAPLPDTAAIPVVDRASALGKMDELNPQILSNVYQASAARKNLGLAWMGLLPDFQVGVNDNQYFVDHVNYASSPLIQTHSLELSATVPLWFLFNESQNILAGTHNSDSAQAGLDSQKEQSETALFAAVDTLDDNAAKLVIYRKHLMPLSEVTLKLALTNYGTGKIQFEDLAAAAAGLWSTRSAYYTLVESYLTEYTQYGELIGEEL